MFFVHLAGHLGRDPETRFTPSGQKVTSFTLAINHRKGKEEATIWVRVTVWGDRFDRLMPHLKKGSAILVMGKMAPPSTYTDREGRVQVSLEVTAEVIEFSPFGRSDRVGGAQPQGTVDYGSGHQNEGPGREEGSFPSHGSAYYGKQPGAYGSSPAIGQGSHTLDHDDEALPF